MQSNRVVCAIEHVLREEGCNEVVVADVFARVRKTRGNLSLGPEEFLGVLRELVAEGLYQLFGDSEELTLDSLIARSQMHPSIPNGGAIPL